MNTNQLQTARRIVSHILLIIVITTLALVLAISSVTSVAYAGDAGGGNIAVHLPTSTATPTP